MGGNSKAARRRTARWGDAWQPTGLTVNAMREGITELRELCMMAGRDFSKIEIGYFVTTQNNLRLLPLN